MWGSRAGLNTRVGRRLLLLFFSCAALPTAGMAVIIFERVSVALHAEGESRLMGTTKAIGLSIYDRLLALESDLRIAGDLARTGRHEHLLPPDWLDDRFVALAVAEAGGPPRVILGDPDRKGVLTGDTARSVGNLGRKLWLEELGGPDPAVLMAVRLRDGALASALLRGPFLWNAAEVDLTNARSFCVLSHSRRTLARSDAAPDDLCSGSAHAFAQSGSGHFELAAEAGAQLVAYRTLFLEGSFGAPSWTVVVGETKTSILRPLEEFGSSFPLIAVAAFCLVSLVSIAQIRRNVGPLEEIQRGTERIRNRDFGIHVEVHSRDEFQDLAESLNDMGDELNQQFHELSRLAESEREQRGRAESAARVKAQFLANMSHEIRTPMMAILGFADLLSEDRVEDDERIEFTSAIQRNSRHLVAIVDDILDLSKIDAGRLRIERQPCSADQIIGEALELLRPQALAKGLDLQLRYLQPIPDPVATDPTRLRQILTNLVHNAIKFTEEGSVRITAAPEGESRPQLRISVTDTGLGMDESTKRRIFGTFVQADSSMTRTHGGTGLGLSIASRLTRMLGGELTVASIRGLGSTFSLTFDTGPLDNCDWIAEPSYEVPSGSVDRTPVPPRQLSRSRVLLAEDGADNRRLISHILRKADLEVAVAENGRLAVEAVRSASEAGEPFDLVLMDMQMPELNGYDATRALRTEGYVVPIIALTAHALTGDREACLSAGCSDYLSKPVNRAALLAMIRAHTETKPDPSEQH